MNIREDVGDFIQHFAWALWGQQCDCGYNWFNRMARWFERQPWASQFDDDLNPLNWQTKATWIVGSRLSDFSIWLMYPENRATKCKLQKEM